MNFSEICLCGVYGQCLEIYSYSCPYFHLFSHYLTSKVNSWYLSFGWFRSGQWRWGQWEFSGIWSAAAVDSILLHSFPHYSALHQYHNHITFFIPSRCNSWVRGRPYHCSGLACCAGTFCDIEFEKFYRQIIYSSM